MQQLPKYVNTMQIETKIESNFKTELNDFEAMLNLGLNKQVSEA